jgi:uncharacterized protein YjbJ (UPF0337 family)
VESGAARRGDYCGRSGSATRRNGRWLYGGPGRSLAAAGTRIYRYSTTRRKQMNPSTKDEIKGTVHEVKGKVKETTGKVTNNPNLQAEGNIEKNTGKVQKKVGQIEKVFKK